MRLTGPVAIQDEEFATLQEGALPNAIGTVVAVLFILWLALKSPKIILAMTVTMLIGLLVTGAFGLWMIGAFNPISIAFAVLFIGIGVDFGIQFSVRYRAERHEVDDLARRAGERGQERRHAAHARGRGDGGGVLLVPAHRLWRLLRARRDRRRRHDRRLCRSALRCCRRCWRCSIRRARRSRWASQWLAPIDRFTERHRIPIIVGTLAIVLGGLPLLYFLQFDFNPMNLRNPKSESIATYLDLRRDPATGASAIDVLAPSLAVANQMKERLEKVPEVSRVVTLETFVPDNQEAKLAAIRKAAAALAPAFAEPVKPPPTDAENVEALDRAVDFLTEGAAEADRTRRRGGQAPGRRHGAAGQGRSGHAREGRGGVRRAARLSRSRDFRNC